MSLQGEAIFGADAYQAPPPVPQPPTAPRGAAAGPLLLIGAAAGYGLWRAQRRRRR